MSPEQRVRVAHDLKQAVQREIAKRRAGGEKSDVDDRIARLAEKKLTALRAALVKGR